MRRIAGWGLVGLLLVALVATAWIASRPGAVAVAVRSAERGPVESTVVNTRAGTIKACRRAKMSPQIGGRIAKLPAREGDRVEAGTVLLELWSEDLRGRLRLAREEAQAARARSEEACLAADLATRDAARFEQLFADGIVDEATLDRVRAERDRSEAGCRAARAAESEARQAIEVARAELTKTVLRAPFDGVVADLNGEIGEFVTPSPPGIPTPPVVDLIDPGCLYVVAPIDEVDAPDVAVGMEARVTIDAFPDRSFPGVVSRVASFVLDLEKQARTVDVEVRLAGEDASSLLLPGYSADAEILLDRREDVLRIPSEAIIEGERVLVLDDGLLVEREVQLGLTNWEYSEVLGGLAEGDLVVLTLDRSGVRAGAQARREAGAGERP